MEHGKRKGDDTGRYCIQHDHENQLDVMCLMEFKHMTDVTNRYVVRAKCVSEEQYVFFRSALNRTMQRLDDYQNKSTSSGE